LWIAIPFVLSLTFNTSGEFGSWYDNLRSFTAVATFTGNVANQFGMTLGPNSVYWSLSLEEQFYFLFPIFLLFVCGTRRRAIVLISLVVFQFFLDRNLFGTRAASLASSVRLDALMWGILIFLFSRRVEYKQFEPTFLQDKPAMKVGMSLLLIYLLGAIPGQMIATPIAVGLVAIVAAILVFFASFNAGYIPRIAGLSVLLEWLGSRSYGIYVIHFPAMRIANEIWFRVAGTGDIALRHRYEWIAFMTSMALVVILSELNYRLVEQPLRRRGAAVAARQLAAIDNGAMAASAT
jgi:peptidoglycan/LPS O-acetylase OafA/YrhL